jgi:CheY-like chemotaxis protein
MTGLGQERDLGPAEAAEVGATLSKPVHAAELRACLRLALGLPPSATDPASVKAEDGSRADRPEAGRLLLAEDNLINQKVAVAILTGAGYRVDTVLNGAAAVQAATTRPYDAILMDCQMPVLSGYEATAAIRVQEGGGRRTPIIAMTAGARREDRQRCLDEGMDGYLSKPVSKDALLATMARFVDHGPAGTTPAPPGGTTLEMMIDPLVIDELRLLGLAAKSDFLAELVDLFLFETEPMLEQLGQALEAGDYDSVSRIAHSIKASCSQLGGRRLAVACDHLEEKVMAGSLSGGRTDLAEMTGDYQDLRRTLLDELSPLDRQYPGAQDA